MRLALVVVTLLAGAATAVAGGQPIPSETHVVPTGPAPCGAAARAGSVWVGVYEAGTLLGIDDASGRVQSRVPVGRWACRVAVGPAAIWVTRDRARELVRVSRGTGRLRRVPVGGMVFDVLLASGSVWATNYDIRAISRIDPATGKVTRRYTDGANPAGLATCGAESGSGTAGTRPGSRRSIRPQSASVVSPWVRQRRGGPTASGVSCG